MNTHGTEKNGVPHDLFLVLHPAYYLYPLHSPHPSLLLIISLHSSSSSSSLDIIFFTFHFFNFITLSLPTSSFILRSAVFGFLSIGDGRRRDDTEGAVEVGEKALVSELEGGKCLREPVGRSNGGRHSLEVSQSRTSPRINRRHPIMISA